MKSTLNKSESNKIIKNINLFDIIAMAVIIIGIVLMMQFDDIPRRLISLGVAFAAILALVNSFFKKNYYNVELRQFNIKSSDKLVTTTISDEKAKRTTIDNFDETGNSVGEQDINHIAEEEGFVLTNRKRVNVANSAETAVKSKKEFAVDWTDDENSSFRITKHGSSFDNKNNKFDNKGINEIGKTVANSAALQESMNRNLFDNKINSAQNSENNLTVEINENIAEKEDTVQEKKIETVQEKSAKTAINQENITINAEKMINEDENSLKAEKNEAEKPAILDNDNTIPTVTSDKINKVENENDKTNSRDFEGNNSENNKEKISENNKNYVTVENEISDQIIPEIQSNSQSPTEDFAYLISHFLMIIRSVLNANTVAFIWVDYESKMLIFDSYLNKNDVKDAMISTNRLKIGNDIVSQIVNSGKPEILSQINPAAELDLLPYYTKPVGTTSFIGIPIFLEQSVIGVLCADTDVWDAYSKTTAEFLRHFTILISVLFSSYSNNLANQNAKRTLDALNNFSNLIAGKDCSFNQISFELTDFITELFDFTSIGICAYNEDKQNWIVSSYKSTEKIDERFFAEPISLNSSLVGTSIASCRTVALTNVPSEYVRVNQFEPKLINGDFISVPIKSSTDTYGALFIEAANKNLISNVEFDVLNAVCNQVGETFEKLHLAALFKSYVSVETRTGILNNDAFHKKIAEEILRANETQMPINLVLVGLDKYTSLEDYSKKSRAFDYIIAEITHQFKPYDILGRVNEDVIGVVVASKDLIQTKLIFERIRQNMATQFIDIGDDKFVITISVGIAMIRRNDTFDNLTSNATVALQQAQQRSNCVQIFQ